MTADPTVAALLEEAAVRLRAAEVPAPAAELDAQLLLAQALGVPRVRLRSHPETGVPLAAERRFRELLQRRAYGEPVAYLTGVRDFWSLSLAVTPAVLVPRPETELLVERALALHAGAAARVADLGTGSGAIALALAAERPGWQVVATDLSAAALAVARANAARARPGAGRVPPRGLVRAARGGTLRPARQQPAVRGRGRPGAGGARHSSRAPRSPPARMRWPACACWPAVRRGISSAAAGCCSSTAPTRARRCARELVARGFSHVRSHRDLAGHERIDGRTTMITI